MTLSDSMRCVLVALCVAMLSCTDQGELPPTSLRLIASDADLFRVVTQEQPFSSYALFPHVDSVTSGTLNGSNAHQPLMRVSMNAIAFNALSDGRLPAGASFPDGSIVFKQIRQGTETVLYAVMYKERGSPHSGNGWLWAEFQPDGTPFISVTRKGTNCTGCHSREQGPQHDFVRTFERQR
ncbi:MAG: cytochrome P460 family protein [Bacteroidota bacterium]